MRPGVREMLSSPALLLACGFGSGLAPRAPGTVGSALALVLYAPLSLLPWWGFVAVIIITLIAGIGVSDSVVRTQGVKDPGFIVIDEFVGLWIALLFLPDGWIWALAGFLLFRFFDILKPWPVSWCDRELDGGLGVMMDDVVAGLYAFAVLQAAALVVAEL